MSMDRDDAMSSPDLRIRRSGLPPARWQLWSQPKRVVVYCLVIETVAVAASVTLLLVSTPTLGDTWLLIALAALGITQAELGRRVERVRRRVSGVAHINMTSVWTFAGVLVLPPVLTAVLVVVLYWHLAARSWYRLQRVPTWRTTSNAASVILTCFAAHQAMAMAGMTDLPEALGHGWPGFAAVATAVAVYFAVGAVVVIGARATIV
ncbi:MAG: hypothetical protein ACRDQB_08635, partial [Thermocrispum sp.]